ncbi:MAG: hypothetical protein HOP28_00020, partial [Gemmatimonadales bacterium]|nr:hypothetical protein [Gemmatimonadales bacterium]
VMATMGTIGIAAVAGYVIVSAKLGLAFAIPVGILGLGGITIVLRGPIGRAFAEALGASPPPDETAGQLLAEVDDLRARLQEIEERVDFSERLLAQHAKSE